MINLIPYTLEIHHLLDNNRTSNHIAVFLKQLTKIEMSKPQIKTNCTVIFLYCTNICFCVLTNQHTSTGFLITVFILNS